MGRKINEDKYGISDRRYKELVYFCLQYREWKKWLKDNQGMLAGHQCDILPKGEGGHSDPVAMLAIKREKLLGKCRVLEMAAEEASPLLARYIIRHVTDGNVTYRYLSMVLKMPCGTKKYYEARRKFFWILDKKI